MGWVFREPVTILMVSLRVMSSLLACALRLHAGEAYSAALYTRARAPVLKVEGLAPHDEPASRRRRLFLEDTLARSESRCCLYVSCLSSFAPRYVGVGLCCSGDPLTFTVSLRRASLVLRWKAVEVDDDDDNDDDDDDDDEQDKKRSMRRRKQEEISRSRKRQKKTKEEDNKGKSNVQPLR